MKNRKMLALLSSLLICSSIVAGCGGNKKEDSKSKNDKTEQTSKEKKDKSVKSKTKTDKEEKSSTAKSKDPFDSANTAMNQYSISSSGIKVILPESNQILNVGSILPNVAGVSDVPTKVVANASTEKPAPVAPIVTPTPPVVTPPVVVPPVNPPVVEPPVIIDNMPVISLAENVVIHEGLTFDPYLYASAYDQEDGCLLVDVEESNVDTNIPGKYQVVYSATDSAGNKASASLSVRVNAKPVIKLPVDPVKIQIDSEVDVLSFVEATDLEDGTVSDVKFNTDLNIHEAGLYEIYYIATDSDGAVTKAVLEVEVTSEAPVLTANDVLLEESRVDPLSKDEFLSLSGASAIDREDGDISSQIEIGEGVLDQIDYTHSGEYTIELKVTDSHGNTTKKNIQFTIQLTEIEVE